MHAILLIVALLRTRLQASLAEGKLVFAYYWSEPLYNTKTSTILDEGDTYPIKTLAYEYLAYAYYDQIEKAEHANVVRFKHVGYAIESSTRASESIPVPTNRSERINKLARSNRKLADFVLWCQEHNIMPLYFAVILSKHKF
jgi:hypothetical protein